MIRRNKWLILILLTMGVLYTQNMFTASISPDEAFYAWQSRTYFENPGNVLSTITDADIIVQLTSIMFDLILPSDIAVRFTVIVFSLLGIFLIYLIGSELKNDKLGILAALILSISPWYWLLTERILIDVPLVSMMLLNILMLIKLIKTRKLKYINYSVGSFFLVFLTKSPGIMILPLNMVVIILCLNIKIRKPRQLAAIVFALVLMFIAPILFASKIARYLTRYANLGRVHDNYLVFNNLFHVLGFVPNLLLPLMYCLTGVVILGMVHIMLLKKKIFPYSILIAWIASVFLFRLIVSSSHIVRYVLPALPAIILLLLVLISDMLEFHKIEYSKLIIACIITFIVAGMLLQSYHILRFGSYTKTGFEDAGLWFSGRDYPDIIIYSGSPSQIRYYSGIEYQDNGGILWTSRPYVGIPKRPSKLNPSNCSTVYLQIDFREKYQPDWVYPNITNAKLIHDLGFRIAYVVYRNQPFYMAPPTEDKTEFLEFWNITPYVINEGKNRIFPPGIEAYSGIPDNGNYLEELGFMRAESIWEYAKFALTFNDTFIEQPVIMIFCSGKC